MSGKLAGALLAAGLAAATPQVRAAEEGLPLPEAPVRLVIPDAAAFDAALTGSFRQAVTGTLASEDPLLAAWRQSPVGSKLEGEWSKLSSDLPWTWAEIRRLQPRRIGCALLSAGSLEAVLVIDTPLAALPFAPPAGTAKSHAGVPFTLVAAGVADAGGSDARRMGLAWARHGGLLLLATSERALRLAIDSAVAGRGVAAFLPGLASLELDLDALRKDRYFVREFAFGTGRDEGRIQAALRREPGGLVEVRTGRAPKAADPAFAFAAGAVAAAGYEPESEGLWPALRRGLLETVPQPSGKPVPPLAPLPATEPLDSDRYVIRLDRPAVDPAGAWGEGEIAAWRDLLAGRPAAGWGWLVEAQGGRALVFEYPQDRQPAIEQACRQTLARRAGRVTEARVDGVLEFRVGPALPALAVRRAGAFVWLGSSAAVVARREAPRAEPDLARWARLDLDAVRAESMRWARSEGPATPETMRPFSDRVLGLLGWIPSVRTISVERRQRGGIWTERVTFGGK